MKVAIFFGSKSDKDTMKKAADILTEFGVDYKAYIISDIEQALCLNRQ